MQIDGVVWDQTIVGDTVYAGGSSPTPARPGRRRDQPDAAGHLLAYNIRTGVLITCFAPTVNGQVKALALSPDNSRLYIGGSFTTVNGANRYRIAAFNTATGALSSFAPAINSTVSSIAVTNDAVYVGGSFNKVGSVAGCGWPPSAPPPAPCSAGRPPPTGGQRPGGDPRQGEGAGGRLLRHPNGSTATGLAAIDASTPPAALRRQLPAQLRAPRPCSA